MESPLEALLKKLGAASPKADKKETTKSAGGNDQSKIGEMKGIKINNKLPTVSLATDPGELRSELLNLANQINGQTTLPINEFLFDGGIYACGMGKITAKNIREMETLLTGFKSAGEISADEAAAMKVQIMSFYPKTEIVEDLEELSTSFDKAYGDLIVKLGVNKKDASGDGVSELIVAAVNLSTKAIELYSSQMECEMRILTAASNNQNILEFESVEDRYLAIPNFSETFRLIKGECDRAKPCIIDILRSDSPAIGQNAMLDDVLRDFPRNVADHIVGLGCSINRMFSDIIALCKPAAGSSDSKAKLTGSRDQLMSMVEAMQFSSIEYRLDTVFEQFGVKGREYLSALENDDSPQARAMLRELGDDVSTTGLLLTMMDLKLDVKKTVRSMTSPADGEFIKLVGKVQLTYGEGGSLGPEKSKSAYYSRSRWNGISEIFAAFSNDFQPDGICYEVTEVTESAMTAAVGAPARPEGKRYADVVKSASGAATIDGEILKTINAITDPSERLAALTNYAQKNTRMPATPFKLAFLHREGDSGERVGVCNYCGDGTHQPPHRVAECMGRVHDRDSNSTAHMSSTAKRWFEIKGKRLGTAPPPLWNADENAIRTQMKQTNFKPGMPHGDRCYACREVIFAEAERRALPKSQRSYDGRGRGGGRGGYRNATAHVAVTNPAPSTGQTQPAQQTALAAAQPGTAGAGDQMTEMHAMLVKLNDRVTEVQTFQKKKKGRKKQQLDWSADDTDGDTDDDQ